VSREDFVLALCSPDSPEPYLVRESIGGDSDEAIDKALIALSEMGDDDGLVAVLTAVLAWPMPE